MLSVQPRYLTMIRCICAVDISTAYCDSLVSYEQAFSTLFGRHVDPRVSSFLVGISLNNVPLLACSCAREYWFSLLTFCPLALRHARGNALHFNPLRYLVIENIELFVRPTLTLFSRKCCSKGARKYYRMFVLKIYRIYRATAFLKTF